METPADTRDLWTYPESDILDVGVNRQIDLRGFSVEAVDGRIGTVEEATYATGWSYIVVDVGDWISGTKVMLPGGLIDYVNVDQRTLYVDRTKDEIKHAPELKDGRFVEEAFMAQVGGYYGGLGGRPG